MVLVQKNDVLLWKMVSVFCSPYSNHSQKSESVIMFILHHVNFAAEPKPPNGKSNSAMDVAIGIGIGIG